jgi:prophage antirepressor-like protein
MQLLLLKYQEDENHFSDIRTVEVDGEIWFVGSDVAKTLGYKRPSEAIRQHCKEKGTVKDRIPTDGGEQEVLLINEPNVYRLIIKSQLPSAERFEEWLFEEVIPQIRKKGFYGRVDRSQIPNFYRRYLGNIHKIELHKHFSVVSELFTILYSELENVGYVIPNKAEDGKLIMPDISVGKMFATYLERLKSPYKDAFEYYEHSFDDGRPDQKARKYTIEALPLFRKYVIEVWIPENAERYFRERDQLALSYLPKLLGK